ncbi:MAG: DUF1667 domain-containing protein [Lachnospiraceae bacterium]|nr:DUF1667 domain-containing protein [Lachnospiraceae bacterium]
MEERKLTCIGCPLGCLITVTIENNEITGITGNTCKRGEIYAGKEVTNPTRIVTSSVEVTGGTKPIVSVKTASDIPKGKIFEVMKSLKGITVAAPVRIKDVILADAAGTGVSIIATKNVEKIEIGD